MPSGDGGGKQNRFERIYDTHRGQDRSVSGAILGSAWHGNVEQRLEVAGRA